MISLNEEESEKETSGNDLYISEAPNAIVLTYDGIVMLKEVLDWCQLLMKLFQMNHFLTKCIYWSKRALWTKNCDLFEWHPLISKCLNCCKCWWKSCFSKLYYSWMPYIELSEWLHIFKWCTSLNKLRSEMHLINFKLFYKNIFVIIYGRI